MSKVLLIGGTGFIGMYVARALSDSGHEVIVAVRPQTTSKAILATFRTITFGSDNLLERLRQFAPEILIDLSWNGVSGQNRNQFEQFANVQRLLTNLQLGVDSGITKYIGFGSQAEYGPKAQAINESDETFPTTLYGAAKLSAMYATKALAEMQNVKHIWVRIFSTYGPGDKSTWLIPSVVSAISKKENLALTAGTQNWDYLYVEDAANAILRICESNEAIGIYNLGSGTTVKIFDVVTKIRNLLSPDFKLNFGTLPFRPDQVMHLEADISRISRDTGWKPITNLDTGLRLTCSNLLIENQKL